MQLIDSTSEHSLDRFAAIHERDVDLLLLEELLCNRSFAGWFCAVLAEQCATKGFPKLSEIALQARHSVNFPGEGAGETDLEVTIRGRAGVDECRVLCLIESKIDAPLMREQLQRYKKRAIEIRERESYDHAVIALVAPQEYLNRVDLSLVDAAISHESLLQVLSQEADPSDDERLLRREHRAAILKHSIERYRRGGNRINDDQRTRFFDDYAKIVQALSPLLQQKPSRPRSKLSDTFFFEMIPYLTKGNVSELYGEHKFREGWVAINFRGWGKERDRGFYVQSLASIKEHDFEIIAPANKQYVRVRISGMPRVDPESPADAQHQAISDCASVIERLMAWYRRHRDRMDSWADSRRSK